MNRPLFLLLLLLMPAFTTSAQTRPRVGLALSGGAAKGLAHIGVLKVMEEVGLPPDYITGTSMGSIVGGLYALGYSADSLRNLTLSLDWNRVLSDNLDLHQVIFEEKLYFRNELIELPIREGKIKQPSGLIQGQQIEELLNRLTLPAFAIDDFDSLPIPFHCMAADIVGGKPVELYHGNLTEALRASMAIPTVFTPVVRDSMVLVDGGLIRNFPVEELKPMGADIIIGVYVGAEPHTEPNSISQILYQIAFMQSIEDYNRQLPLIDIYIEPDCTGYSVQDFTSADSIINRGELAARRQYDRLKALADSLNAIGPPYPHRRLPPVTTIRLDQTRVIGNRQIDAGEIIGQTNLRPPRLVTADDLQKALEYLYGTNRYQKISYQIRKQRSDNVLTLFTEEKAPYLLKTALTYDSYHEAGLAFNLTLRNLLLNTSRLMLVGRIADNYRYRLEYLKYLNRRQTWFFNTVARYNRDAIPLLRAERITEEFRLRDAPIDLTLNHRIGRNILLSLGGQFEFLSLRPKISEAPLYEHLRFQNVNLLAGLQTNSLNRNVLPSHGTRLNLEFRFVTNLGYQVSGLAAEVTNPDSLFKFRNYPKISFRSENYLPLGNRASLILSPFLHLLGNPRTPITDVYLVGGPEMLTRRSIPFQGLGPNELIIQTAIGTDIGAQFFLRDNLALGFLLSGGLFGLPEFGASRVPTPDTFLSGGGVSIAYNTIVGPVKFSLMYPFITEGNLRQRVKAFLSFGHRF